MNNPVHFCVCKSKKISTMNRKVILQSLITLSLFTISLVLLTSSDTILVELGKGVLLVSVLSLFPLAHASATAQLTDKPYESTQIRELVDRIDKKNVA